MTRPEFEKLVRAAIRRLPPHFRRQMAEGNLVIVVEDSPSRAQLLRMKMDPDHESLYGLYEGIPLPHRTGWYNMAVPDKITIFQDVLESAYPNELALKEQVRKTVLHEVAHFFGIDDAELRRMGWY